MTSPQKTHNTRIADSFGRRSAQYDHYATLQAKIATQLSDYLPQTSAPHILEIGCGTGFLTQHIVTRYPESKIYITDLSEDMLTQCKKKIGSAERLHYVCCDGEALTKCDVIANHKFDLIVSSMTLQWFQNANDGLRKLTSNLKENGTIYFATLGPDNFTEWQTVLKQYNYPSGTWILKNVPGLFSEEKVIIDYGSAYNFFRSLKAIGAHNPKTSYSQLPAGQLRKAMHALDRASHGKVSWHIVYGCLKAL